MMDKKAKIYVAGHSGLVGSAVMRALKSAGYKNVVTAKHKALELRNAHEVKGFFSIEKPEYVFLCAAKVGGIGAHVEKPVDFYLDNVLIQANVMHSAHLFGVKKLLFLGSACAYPRLAPCPIREDSLLDGRLEPSNEGYALAKISGIRACGFYRKQYGSNFVPVMPTNLYGRGDNYDLQTSHVLPAMIRRFFECDGQKVTLWGTGNPVREFLHADDLADALLFLMGNYDSSDLINIGTGEGVPLKGLAELIAHRSGFKGHIEWDESKPDGTPIRYLDCSKLFSLGWKPKINLVAGIDSTYQDFLSYIKDVV